MREVVGGIVRRVAHPAVILSLVVPGSFVLLSSGTSVLKANGDCLTMIESLLHLREGANERILEAVIGGLMLFSGGFLGWFRYLRITRGTADK